MFWGYLQIPLDSARKRNVNPWSSSSNDVLLRVVHQDIKPSVRRFLNLLFKRTSVLVFRNVCIEDVNVLL